jgi:polyhydroxybutyrate depolymerase
MLKTRLGVRELELQMTYAGAAREYVLHIPPASDQALKPLVLALHGGGGTARGMLKLTGRRMNDLADRHGFYVVYPQGLGKSWNEGAEDSKGYAREHKIDDVGFLKALIEKIAKEYPIDRRRVFSTGISNGGLMSYRLACEMPDQIRAIAPIAASIPQDIVGLCSESRGPVGLMVLNGTKDPVVPYQGGQIKVFGSKRGQVISTDETIRIWLKKNDCSDTPQTQPLMDRDSADGTRVISHIYNQCQSGVPVVLYEIQGGGHTWPGGWQYLREKRIGRTTRDIFADDEVWSFFESFK